MKEKVIERYFQSWVDKDSSVIDGYFDESIVYIESYGPVYKGQKQCQRWFHDWNKVGSVLCWNINRIKSVNETFFVEWFFECDYKNSVDKFDGVSIIEFNGDKIISVKEFQSKHQHNFPYGEND